MSKVLSKLLFFVKYILLIFAFALIFLGMIAMYKRLDKPFIESISVFIPFALVLLIFIVSLFIGKKESSENLLFNFGCFLILTVIIIIGLRAKFDTNMLIYHEYNISYNPAFLADNLSMIQSMLYIVFGSNLLLIISSFFGKKKVVKVSEEVKVVKEVEDEKVNNKKVSSKK